MADRPTRKSGRARVVSTRFGAVVSHAERAAAAAARLDALEADDDADVGYGGLDQDEDDDFVPSDEEDGRAGRAPSASPATELRIGGPSNPAAAARAAAAAARKTRAARAAAASSRRTTGPRSFATLLEEARLDEDGGGGGPHWLSAAVGPPLTAAAPRAWCSICGHPGEYSCVRCRARFCGRKCGVVHAETRCLKMVG